MINEKFKPGDFNSIIPIIENNYNGNPVYINNIDYNHTFHEKILNDLPNKLKNFDDIFGYNFSSKKTSNSVIDELSKIKDNELLENKFRYYLCNGSFEWMDGRMLFYFMAILKPNKIIEVGTGNSTLLMVNAKQILNLNTKIICIDKNPHEIIKKLNSEDEILLFEEDLNNIDIKIFEALGKNDILFIDSSHALKINSDVLYYFSNIFPILSSGVFVQIHDIFLPYEYPLSWMEEGVFWNEQYLLYVFLQASSKFKIVFSNGYCKYKFSDKLLELQKDFYENKVLIERINPTEPFYGGSIWFRVN